MQHADSSPAQQDSLKSETINKTPKVEFFKNSESILLIAHFAASSDSNCARAKRNFKQIKTRTGSSGLFGFLTSRRLNTARTTRLMYIINRLKATVYGNFFEKNYTGITEVA